MNDSLPLVIELCEYEKSCWGLQRHSQGEEIVRLSIQKERLHRVSNENILRVVNFENL